MKRLRIVLRWTHLVGAGVIGTYLYSPWSSLPAFQFAVQVVVFPFLLSVTGLAMWQQARLKRLISPRTKGGSDA